MAEELEENRPLTEEERRENLRKLLGEEKADDYFDAAYQSTYDPIKSDPKELLESSSPVNWKILGFALVVFILVMIGAAVVTGQSVQEETVDTPVSLTGQNGGAGGIPTR